MRGDADGDGDVDFWDGRDILDFVLHGENASCVAALDADDDDDVDLDDAVFVLATASGVGPSPELPFPGCGSDPTPGSLHCDLSPCP